MGGDGWGWIGMNGAPPDSQVSPQRERKPSVDTKVVLNKAWFKTKPGSKQSLVPNEPQL